MEAGFLKITNSMLSWQEVEKNIFSTKQFLKNNLLLSPYRQEDHIKCNDCILRYLSLLIISGQIKITKISAKNTLWPNNSNSEKIDEKMHGAIWHNFTINKIDSYFTSRGYKTLKEPNLFYGRADLAITDLKFHIEIGTINIYKLLINLCNMKNCRIIVVPDDSYILEFLL